MAPHCLQLIFDLKLQNLVEPHLHLFFFLTGLGVSKAVEEADSDALINN